MGVQAEGPRQSRGHMHPESLVILDCQVGGHVGGKGAFFVLFFLSKILSSPRMCPVLALVLTAQRPPLPQIRTGRVGKVYQRSLLTGRQGENREEFILPGEDLGHFLPEEQCFPCFSLFWTCACDVGHRGVAAAGFPQAAHCATSTGQRKSVPRLQRLPCPALQGARLPARSAQETGSRTHSCRPGFPCPACGRLSHVFACGFRPRLSLFPGDPARESAAVSPSARRMDRTWFLVWGS